MFDAFDFEREFNEIKKEPVKLQPQTTYQPVQTTEEVELHEWFDQHFYRYGETFFPSVTTILSVYPNALRGLLNWRGEIGNDEANRIFHEAGEKGTFIHQNLTKMLEGKTFYFRPLKDDEQGIYIKDQWDAVQLYRLWQFFTLVKPKVIENEMRLISKEYQFAGSCDLLLDIKDGHYNVNGKQPLYIPSGLYIADLKTSNYLHEQYWCQVAAYTKAYEEMNPNTKIRGIMILHTKAPTKEGIEGFSCKLKLDDEIDKYFDDFLKVYEVWKINPYPNKPKIMQFPNKLKLNI